MKLVADIMLSASTEDSFQHEGRFLGAWEEKFKNTYVPYYSFLGVDFNRIGEYMVAVANPNTPIDISEIMKQYKEQYGKISEMGNPSYSEKIRE